ncbi:MAG: c-type cytochrome [Ottowia sp.]|uniref:c-type cytochrome n=1 Tax=unclassified Ottowia TaxID=2645081 RepID=UPI003C2BD407
MPVSTARWAAAALVLTSAAASAQTDPLQVRSWAAACANCHGTNGRAEPGSVSLAGGNKDDMLKKLMDFKSGAKPATIMHQISKGYTDAQLAAIAAWFETQKK